MAVPPVAAGDGGDVCRLGDLSSRVFIAQHSHRLVSGADELELAGTADFRKVSVFRQEAVARVNRLAGADFRRRNKTVNFQVAVRRFGGPDAVGFVCVTQIF